MDFFAQISIDNVWIRRCDKSGLPIIILYDWSSVRSFRRLMMRFHDIWSYPEVLWWWGARRKKDAKKLANTCDMRTDVTESVERCNCIVQTWKRYRVSAWDRKARYRVSAWDRKACYRASAWDGKARYRVSAWDRKARYSEYMR